MRAIRDILFVAILVIVSLIPLFQMERKAVDSYRISVDGEVIARGNLTVDTILTAPVKEGNAVIEVAGGRVRILENSCPHKYCMRMGWTDRSAKPLVCIPNELVVEVQASDKLDGLLR